MQASPEKEERCFLTCSLGTTTWHLYCPSNGLTLSDQGYLWALQIQPLQNLPDYGEDAVNPTSPSGSNSFSKVWGSWNNAQSNNMQLSKYCNKVSPMWHYWTQQLSGSFTEFNLPWNSERVLLCSNLKNSYNLVVLFCFSLRSKGLTIKIKIQVSPRKQSLFTHFYVTFFYIHKILNSSLRRKSVLSNVIFDIVEKLHL